MCDGFTHWSKKRLRVALRFVFEGCILKRSRQAFLWAGVWGVLSLFFVRVLTDAGRMVDWVACCCLKEGKRVWTANRNSSMSQAGTTTA